MDNQYETRVNELEAEGLTRSDAQAIVDAEDLQRVVMKRLRRHHKLLARTVALIREERA